MIIPLGHYSSIQDVLEKMDELVDSEKRFKDDGKFSYDSLSRKVTVQLQNNAEVYFGDIGYTLGFSPEEIISKTSYCRKRSGLRTQLS